MNEPEPGSPAPAGANLCGYCGRENAADATFCHECGTGLSPEKPETPPLKPGSEWIEHWLRYVAWFVLILAVYLLSMGPVLKLTGKSMPAPWAPPPTTSSSNVVVAVSSRITTYPAWVGFVYYPAWLVARMGREGHSLTGLYTRYLDWWIRPEE